MVLEAIDTLFASERSRILARLVRASAGDFFAAEDALSDAVAAALQQWPEAGVPDRPGAWIQAVALRRLIDGHRRQGLGAGPTGGVERVAAEPHVGALEGPFAGDDDRLGLLFACCHPSLDGDAQVALTLNALCGMRAQDIARAYLVRPAAMAQRIVRAKQKIRRAGISLEVPAQDDLAGRLGHVLQVVYLVFNEGHTAAAGDALCRHDLAAEAVTLCEQLVSWMPGCTEARGLLALVLLHHARRLARTSERGELILLEDQDRSLWDAEQMAAGRGHLERALAAGPAGPYAVQAAIAAVHSEAESAVATDWAQIEALYDRLVAIQPAPVAELNRAVAVAMHRGAEAGLVALEQRVDARSMEHYVYYHATRADLLRRLARAGEARAAYRRALDLADNAAERRFLTARLAALE